MDKVKVCSTCKLESTNFNKNTRSKDGLNYTCRCCESKHRKEHYANNKEVYKKKHSEWYAANKQEHNKKVTTSYILRKFGLTQEAYSALLSTTDSCEICMQKFTTTPCVDHCHTTGKVRGLLCRPCNFALGLFADNKTNLQKAIIYLDK